MATLDDARIAAAVVEAVAEFDDSLAVFTIAGSEMSDVAARAGLPVVTEFFADRPLRGDGSVIMFGWADVFSATPETLSERVRDLVAVLAFTALGVYAWLNVASEAGGGPAWPPLGPPIRP